MRVAFAPAPFPQPRGFATFAKWSAMFCAVRELSAKQRRQIFATLRRCEEGCADTLLPALGMTFGEFCFLQQLICTRK